jgi:hypothetical protein
MHLNISKHLRLGLPSGLLPSGFPTNNLLDSLHESDDSCRRRDYGWQIHLQTACVQATREKNNSPAPSVTQITVHLSARIAMTMHFFLRTKNQNILYAKRSLAHGKYAQLRSVVGIPQEGRSDGHLANTPTHPTGFYGLH